MYYAYIPRSLRDDNFYAGYTEDLQKRLKEHFSGESFATKSRTPLQLVYFEGHRSKKDAFARERFLKTGWGRNYLKRILKNYLVEID